MARQNEELELFEAELIDAWRDLAGMPDRERAFLAAGSKSCWPQVLRGHGPDRWTDYPGDETPRRPGLSRAQMRRQLLLLTGEGCATSAVWAERAKLVATVLNLKAWPERRGFRWETVFERMGGKQCGVTKETLESRYKAQLVRMMDRYHRAVGREQALDSTGI